VILAHAPGAWSVHRRYISEPKSVRRFVSDPQEPQSGGPEVFGRLRRFSLAAYDAD